MSVNDEGTSGPDESVESTESVESIVEVRPLGQGFRRVATNNRNIDNNITIGSSASPKPAELTDLLMEELDEE